MPFTLSHPAAVLPFGGRAGGRWALALPPLVAGSMAPDVPYYTPLPGSLRGWTHSVAGAFTIDVVLAVALLAVGVFVAGPVAALLPARRRELVGGWTAHAWPSRVAWPAVGLWYAALVLGALTHVAWDAFTHPDGQVVTRVPALSDVVAGNPLYQWMQWGSTVVGGAIVVLAVRRHARTMRAGTAGAPDLVRLVVVTVLVLACAGLGAVAKSEAASSWSTFSLATGFGAGLVAAVLVYATLARSAGWTSTLRPPGDPCGDVDVSTDENPLVADGPAAAEAGTG